jgi:transposase-like protein
VRRVLQQNPGWATAAPKYSANARLRRLKARGLGGVQPVIADAHLGVRQAVAAVLAAGC